MLNLSKSKKDELERLYFFGEIVKKQLAKVTDADLEAYFAFSERGVKPKVETDGYWALNEAKRWQGIHVHELYEPGVMDCSMPYMAFIEPSMPRSVIDFLKREMFKGQDAHLIEEIYAEKR